MNKVKHVSKGDKFKCRRKGFGYFTFGKVYEALNSSGFKADDEGDKHGFTLSWLNENFTLVRRAKDSEDQLIIKELDEMLAHFIGLENFLRREESKKWAIYHRNKRVSK